MFFFCRKSKSAFSFNYKECFARNPDLYISFTSGRNINSNLYREVDSPCNVFCSGKSRPTYLMRKIAFCQK